MPRSSHPTLYRDVSRPAVTPNQKCNRNSFRAIRSDTFSCGSNRLRAETCFALQSCCPRYAESSFTSVSARRNRRYARTRRTRSWSYPNYLQLAAVFTRWSLRWTDEVGCPCTIYLLFTAHRVGPRERLSVSDRIMRTIESDTTLAKTSPQSNTHSGPVV